MNAKTELVDQLSSKPPPPTPQSSVLDMRAIYDVGSMELFFWLCAEGQKLDRFINVKKKSDTWEKIVYGAPQPYEPGGACQKLHDMSLPHIC